MIANIRYVQKIRALRDARLACRLSLLAVTVLSLFAACSGSGPKRAPPRSTATRSAGTPPAVVRARDPAQWPFDDASPWNTPIGTQATLSSPAQPCTVSLITRSSEATISSSLWSVQPIVASTSDPEMPVRVKGEVREVIHVPVDAKPSDPQVSQNGDADLVVIDPTHRYADELWRARRTRDGWEGDAYVRNDLDGPGVGTGGIRAYGGSALGGLIRADELRRHSIPHALALALTRDQMRYGPVWPAIFEDSFNPFYPYAGNVPMGSLVALPRFINVDALGFSPATTAIAHALQDYGAYVVDSSANFTFFAEPSADPFIGHARNDFERLQSLLRCVTDNGPDSVGGAGPPSAPLAPPIAAPF